MQSLHELLGLTILVPTEIEMADATAITMAQVRVMVIVRFVHVKATIRLRGTLNMGEDDSNCRLLLICPQGRIMTGVTAHVISKAELSLS